MNTTNNYNLDTEYNQELREQVDILIKDNWSNRVVLFTGSIYYPSNNDMIQIELEDSSIQPMLSLKFKTNPKSNWINQKFNYSVSSIKRLLEQLEYLNIQLHIHNKSKC